MNRKLTDPDLPFDPYSLTWAEVLSGARTETKHNEEWRESLARKWAGRLRKEFRDKPNSHPEVFWDAVDRAYPRLHHELRQEVEALKSWPTAVLTSDPPPSLDTGGAGGCSLPGAPPAVCRGVPPFIPQEFMMNASGGDWRGPPGSDLGGLRSAVWPATAGLSVCSIGSFWSPVPTSRW